MLKHALIPFLFLTLIHANAHADGATEVLCGSHRLYSKESPRLSDATEWAKDRLNQQLSAIPEAGAAGYYGKTPIEVSSKRVCKTELVSSVAANVTGESCGDWGRWSGYCTEASICATVQYVYQACKVRFDPNTGAEFAICPSGRRIEKKQ